MTALERLPEQRMETRVIKIMWGEVDADTSVVEIRKLWKEKK